MQSAIERARSISRIKKEKYFKTLSEDDFRDRIVRPLLYRLGYKDGRDLCGPFEHGKDAVFAERSKIGTISLTAVQTKKGNLNLASKASNNLLDAIAQVRTCLCVDYVLVKHKKKQKPDKVLLVCSGTINDAARTHIASELNDPRIDFLDIDELIDLIDENHPEVWFGIDAELVPYYNAVKAIIEGSSYPVPYLSASKDLFQGAATDENFIPLQAYRHDIQIRKRQGKVLRVPKYQELDIEDLIAQSEKRILLIGEGGSGKSTALKRIAYKAIQRGISSNEEYTIPLIIPAVDIANRAGKGVSLVDILSDFACRLANTSSPCFTRDDLERGRVVLLIDALDEIATDHQRKIVLQLIDEFHNNYPDAQVILASRHYSYIRQMSELSSYSDYTLSPISLRQANRILENVQRGKGIPREQSKELLRRIDQVHGIELSPLLVTVFAATADYNRSDIPANITELFKKFTEYMLGRWDEGKGLSQQFHGPLKDFLCSQIAFEMHVQNKTRVTRKEFERAIQGKLESRGHEADVEKICHEILDRSGLFRMIGEEIEFRHHLLQEFFAGRAIPDLEFIKSHVHEDWWRRPIVFFFGDDPSAISDLKDVTTSVFANNPSSLVEAANTIGLALQACYLSQVDEKLDIWRSVCVALSIGVSKFLDDLIDEKKYPIHQFLGLYLLCRDAVALSNVKDRYQELMGWWKSLKLSDDRESDAVGFWLAVALIEVGDFSDASKFLKQFSPSDRRYYLAIHLGCFLAYEIRMLKKSDKDDAKKIMEQLAPKIENLRQKVVDEFRSELLEVRSGKIISADEE